MPRAAKTSGGYAALMRIVAVGRLDDATFPACPFMKSSPTRESIVRTESYALVGIP
jgi:hypothetical protein